MVQRSGLKFARRGGKGAYMSRVGSPENEGLSGLRMGSSLV